MHQHFNGLACLKRIYLHFSSESLWFIALIVPQLHADVMIQRDAGRKLKREAEALLHYADVRYCEES